jgi:nucleoside-diphosphate-sugar epimerase
MDVSRINEFGWKHKIDLPTGISKVYEDFLKLNLPTE